MFNNIKKMIPRFTRFPFVWILITLWATSRYFAWDIGIGSKMGVTLMLLSFVVMALEFSKVADIRLNTFRIELASAIICLIVMTVSVTCIIMNNGLSGLFVSDVIVTAITLIDAWLSPSASFVTALRNLQAGSNVSVGAGGEDASD